MNEQNEEKAKADVRSGVFLFLIGSALVGYFVIWPVWQVQHHAPEITYSIKGSGLGVIFLILGTMMVVAPEKTAVLLKLDKNDLKLKDILLMGGLAILSLGLVGVMDLYFSSMGYD